MRVTLNRHGIDRSTYRKQTMVTTGTAEISAAKSVTAAGQRADAGDDESAFAKLLGGSVSSNAAAGTPAPAASNGKVGNGKSIHARAQTEVAQPVSPSADMLALCGLPATTPTSMPEVTATDKVAGTSDTSAQALAAEIDPAVMITPPPVATASAQTQIEPASAQGVKDSGDARPGPSVTDLRWLQGGLCGDGGQAAVAIGAVDKLETGAGTATQLNQQPTQPAAQLAAQQIIRQSAEQSTPSADQQITGQPHKHTMIGSSGAIETPLVPDSAAASPEKQPDVEKLLAHVTPTMGMMNTQLREADVDKSSRELASGDEQNSTDAMNAAALQPAGTQLASDAPVIDVSMRHQLHAPVGTHQWANELGNKLTMMATKDIQSATLYMTPADLGPIQVRIDLNQNQASVWFTAEHAETRSALEQSLPRLREMFTAQGMSLTDAGVFGDRSRQQQTDSGFTSTRFVSSQYEDGEALADTATVRSISLGLLDAYA
jgi:flagellar hook-length control protein FliK